MMSIQLRRGNKSDLISNNSIYDSGELVIENEESTISRIKLGDNSTTYTDLPYVVPNPNLYTDSAIQSNSTFSIDFKDSLSLINTDSSDPTKYWGIDIQNNSILPHKNISGMSLGSVNTKWDSAYIDYIDAGRMITSANQYFSSNGDYGLDLSNSDMINLNGLFFSDASNTPGEGINFWSSGEYWDTLYALSNKLYFHPNRATMEDPKGYEVLTTNSTINTTQLSYNTTLFTGEWSSGYQSIPNMTTGYLYKITFPSQGTTVIAQRYGNYIRGTGGFASSARSYIYFVNLTRDTTNLDRWNYTACTEISIDNSTLDIKMENANLSISNIYLLM